MAVIFLCVSKRLGVWGGVKPCIARASSLKALIVRYGHPLFYTLKPPAANDRRLLLCRCTRPARPGCSFSAMKSSSNATIDSARSPLPPRAVSPRLYCDKNRKFTSVCYMISIKHTKTTKKTKNLRIKGGCLLYFRMPYNKISVYTRAGACKAPEFTI